MNGTTIGRDAQRAAARALVDRAAAGTGSIALVCGPEGIGKSRFLESVGTVAAECGAVAVRATNYETVRAPFGPFADLIEALRPTYPEIAPTDPANRTLFDRCFGIGTSPADFTGDRRRLFVVLADALTRAAQRAPLCLLLDDAHWADPESLEFLTFFGSRVGRTRIVVFVTLRDGDEDGSASDLAIALERFENCTRIALQPLDDRAARELIAFTVPIAASLPGRTVDDICRLSEGNPLFIAELVHVALAHDGTVTLPRSAQHATLKRLKAIEPRFVRTIETAAALGHSFALDDLTTVADVSRSHALEALRAARDAAFLIEDPWIAERFVFRHEIVRTTIYESMFAAERMDVHRAIAAAFEAKNAAPERLADHWRRAGDRVAAAAYAERAGDEALAIGAYASARDRYCDVLESASGGHAAEIARKLARACGALGDTATARTHLADAISHYRAADENATVAELECAYSDVAYRCGDVTGAIEAARRAIDEPAARPEDRFTARVSLATYYAYRPDVELARDEIARADALTEGRPLVQELRLEWARATLALETSHDDAWRAPAEASLAMAERYRDPRILALTAMNFAAMARECGRPDLARPTLARAIEVADSNGLVFAAALARCEAIEELYAAGRLDEALAKIRDVVALQVQAPIVRVALAVMALPVLVDLGISKRFGMIADRGLLDVAFAMHEHTRFAALAGAFAYEDAMADRADEARTLIGRALDGLSSTRFLSGALVNFARFGTADHIFAVQRLFDAEIDRRVSRPYRALVDAIHERAGGNTSRAKSAALRAAELAKTDGLMLVEAYGYELAGSLKEAIAQYERCGAKAHVRRLAPERGALTKREREIASVLREGRSNRAIAERLVLSERTVENHVAAIYAKLGVKTRAEFLRLPLVTPSD